MLEDDSTPQVKTRCAGITYIGHATARGVWNLQLKKNQSLVLYHSPALTIVRTVSLGGVHWRACAKKWPRLSKLRSMKWNLTGSSFGKNWEKANSTGRNSRPKEWRRSKPSLRLLKPNCTSELYLININYQNRLNTSKMHFNIYYPKYSSIWLLLNLRWS